ncbi:MAG: 5'-methylthioadenosine phosphorylase [Cycloclasticus sp. symbiont of Poecilosclerida sp. N]|nr:MAG: 5'-methylthioadenosine phosphorylase [Cycloclasticus sp. symbiont of Poecilosclerida sp. N]
MSALGVIGGTGLSQLVYLTEVNKRVIKTPYGEPSSALTFGKLDGVDVIFMARHGYGHTIPPHKINYQANIWALKEAGAANIVAVTTVGSMNQTMAPGHLVLPNQLIDYTWGRCSTYFEDDLEQLVHIDFTKPYSVGLREQMITAMMEAKVIALNEAVYACTQGPRLETAAEIIKLRRDGCDLVGMTGMPEAALAKELKLDYACCAVVANWAAGLDGDEINMNAIEASASEGMLKLREFLKALVKQIKKAES